MVLNYHVENDFSLPQSIDGDFYRLMMNHFSKPVDHDRDRVIIFTLSIS